MAGRSQKLSAELTEIEKAHKESERGLGRLRDAHKGSEAALKERESGFPKGQATRAALKDALSAARAKDEALKSAYEQARKDDLAAQKSVDASEQTSETAQANLKTTQKKAEEALSKYESRLRAAGFADEKDHERAVRPAADIKRLDGDIQAWKESSHKTEDRFARAKAAVAGQARPPVAAQEKMFEAAQASHAAANDRRGQARERIKNCQLALEVVLKAEGEAEAAEKEYKVVGAVADAAGGDNDRGMSFHRFVLGARLDDVLAQASTRLTVMSRGRYRLTRAIEREDGRSAGGLELTVSDEYTGKDRPVKTLSGGESFLASLALALGLSDAVQASAGGVRLECMVVDEGFGTLDPEALDAAVHALEELQAGGRLVGVISHVPEMKERIPIRLEVVKNRTGSTASFIL